MSKYQELCWRVEDCGLRVELVAGAVLIKERVGGIMVESRNIVELRITHLSKRLFAAEKMAGLNDRDRAAGALLARVTLPGKGA